jgi:tetratricopeptide (TPR) repeat protein
LNLCSTVAVSSLVGCLNTSEVELVDFRTGEFNPMFFSGFSQEYRRRCRILALPLGMFAGALVQAQTFSDLANVVFYPLPLPALWACQAQPADPACPALPQSDEQELVEMARFEEVDIGRYREEIDRLQESWGPYAADLAEKFLSTGLLYQQLDQHGQALEYLGLAADASRIQSGPYSVEQISLAEHAIVSLVALQRLDEVEAKYSALLDLNRSIYGADALQTARSMLRAGQFQIAHLHQESLRNGPRVESPFVQPGAGGGVFPAPVSSSKDSLYRAQALFHDAVRILVQNEAWTDPAIFELEYSLIRTYFVDAHRYRSGRMPGSFGINDSSARSRMHSRANRMALPAQYRKGEQAYQRMIGYLKKDETATVDAIAEVMTGLADWHLLFGQYPKAQAQYRQLEKLLSLVQTPVEYGEAVLNPSVPLPLPAFMESAISSTLAPSEGPFDGYIDVDITIGRTGSISKLEVLEASSGASRLLVDHLVRVLRGTTFRAGADTATNSLVRYYFNY